MLRRSNRSFEAMLQLSPWILTWIYSAVVLLSAGNVFHMVPFTLSVLLSLAVSHTVRVWLRSNISFSLAGMLSLTIIVVQIQSLQLSGDLLSALALTNAESAKVISVKATLVLPYVILFALIVLVSCRPPFCRIRYGILPKCVVASAWLALSVQNLTASGLANPLRLPELSLALTALGVAFPADILVEDNEVIKTLNARFERESVFLDEAAYNDILASAPAKPNILVLFVEGMSARLMESYGGEHAGLTPNLDSLFKESLVADNYYNHTAATLRGLRGQMTSSFVAASENGPDGLGVGPIDGLKAKDSDNTLVSLTDILNRAGYDTAFLSPHPSYMNINELLRGIGFSRVVTGSDVAAAKGLPDISVTDKQLLGYLPDLLQSMKSPFFIGVYNFGTHLFEDSPDVKYGDRRSVVLNRFHNFDTQFGEFIRRFRESPLSKNTILIVTSDHATFPAPEFLAVEDATPNVFVDRIPLMIYWDGVRHLNLDMKGRNSLAFAPTVLNIVGLKNERNFFLGCSIFQDECLPSNHVSKIDEHYFFTEFGNVTHHSAITDPKHPFFEGKKEVDRFLTFSGF